MPRWNRVRNTSCTPQPHMSKHADAVRCAPGCQPHPHHRSQRCCWQPGCTKGQCRHTQHQTVHFTMELGSWGSAKRAGLRARVHHPLNCWRGTTVRAGNTQCCAVAMIAPVCMVCIRSSKPCSGILKTGGHSKPAGMHERWNSLQVYLQLDNMWMLLHTQHSTMLRNNHAESLGDGT
jgi:hypothetical protein